MKVPSEDILTGRRALEGINGFDMLEDISWIEPIKKWHLKICLTVDGIMESEISASTDWHILIDDEYPWGGIKFYPDKNTGINSTYQHQNHNGILTDFAWKSGDLCLSTNFGSFALRGFDSEPKNTQERLEWHVRRCMEWIFAASRNELALSGQFFELPHFPICSGKRFFFFRKLAKFLGVGSVERAIRDSGTAFP